MVLYCTHRYRGTWVLYVNYMLLMVWILTGGLDIESDLVSDIRNPVTDVYILALYGGATLDYPLHQCEKSCIRPVTYVDA